ncbi:MAG: PAS domain-containing protein [Pseudomonadota bacterium]|jgi:PAS domain S-box-containing protein
MERMKIKPTGVERKLSEEDIIVSKTDPTGRITYVNQTLLDISDFTEDDLIGQQHSIVRHPQMPRCVFKLMWETIQSGQEIFAYVVNLTKFGDHYWVFAHVTPTFDNDGSIIGFHSNRRSPDRKGVQNAEALYRILLDEEQRHADRRKGMLSATELLQSMLADKGSEYDEFVMSL